MFLRTIAHPRGHYADASANEDRSETNIRHATRTLAVQDHQEGRVGDLCLSIFSFLLTMHRLFHGNFVLNFADCSTHETVGYVRIAQRARVYAHAVFYRSYQRVADMHSNLFYKVRLVV